MIEIVNMSHRFSDGTPGLQNISLTIHEGEFIVLAGHNGCGKTTLFKHLNGLLSPETGEVKLYGASVSADILKARQTVGLVFQDADSQIVGETVYADVAFGPENLLLSPEEVHTRVLKALRIVALDHLAEQHPHKLSGGEKRRLAIAGILAMKPKILVLDEPFSNLDYPGVLQVLSKIDSLHRSGKTILLSTHDLDKVYGYAQRLILMKNGTIIGDDSFESLVHCVEEAGLKMPCRCGMENHHGSYAKT